MFYYSYWHMPVTVILYSYFFFTCKACAVFYVEIYMALIPEGTIKMSKKKLIIFVGDDALVQGFGIETQALDSKGIGTGLPNVKVQDDVEVTSVANVRELSSIIKNDLREDRERVAVLGDSQLLNPVDEQRLEDLKSDVKIIDVSIDSKTSLKDIIEKSSELRVLEEEASQSDLESIEGSEVSEPETEVSVESYLDSKFSEALNSIK